MSRRRLAAFVVFVALTPAALADPAAEEAAIRQRFLDWTEAFNARDADGACDLFAPDLAYALPEVAQGTRATICGNFARLFARPGLTLRYDPPLIHEILIEGDLAVVRLRWTLTTEADGLRETGVEEGMDVLRRQPDGRWAIARFVAFTPEAE
jgi:steroid delta-isomerase